MDDDRGAVFDDSMDDIDRAFLASVVPAEWRGEGFVAVAVAIDDDGNEQYLVYSRIGGHPARVLGALHYGAAFIAARVMDQTD